LNLIIVNNKEYIISR